MTNIAFFVKNTTLNYITVENISKSYGELELFSDLSFSIHKDDKIAFVAKNGSGKTSILNILSGADVPDSGQVVMRNGLRVSFLSQDPQFDPKLTINDTIFNSESPQLKIIENYDKALQNPEDADAYQKAFEQMEIHNAWEFELQFKQILSKLNLVNLDQKISTMSGGQIKRLALAQALISNPDLLVLDEPTNHLDLEMIEWLEQYFAKAQFTLFMVTH
ncbi:MAG: ATP-binding cassette subfamily F protein uup, partial [Sediminicola sp.]